MEQKKRELYEGMFIISPTLSDDARNKAMDKISHIITQRGGEVKKLHDWGRKRLAFEINGHSEGNYYLLYFEVRPSAINEIWKEFHLHEDLLRFMTLKANEVVEKIEFKQLVETA